MLNKNSLFTAKCIDYTYDGLGIVKDEDGFTYFVKEMLLGEKAELKVIKVLKNYGVARIEKLLERSEERVEPLCPVYKQCGGCAMQHLSIKAQQTFKTNHVKQCMERIAHDDPNLVQDCLMDPRNWNYRNKAQFPVGEQKNHLVTGFYKAHTNDIIPCEHCHIQDERANVLVNRARQLLDAYGIKAYDKVTHKGCLRHLLVKTSTHYEEMMLVIITNGKAFKKKEQFINKMILEFPQLTTIVQNINERHDNVILGDEEEIWYGPGYIHDTLDGLHFQISSKSFYQVNPIQVETLYGKALEFCDLKGDETVIDAYCGIGTISLFLARKAKKVYGVEIVEQAIINAKENAINNNIDNCEFFVGDAGKFMTDSVKQNRQIDIVVCDPPRKGCSQEFLDAVITLNPKKFVYISCNVSTQARDIAYMKEHGFILNKVQPVDLFPQTHHVETVVLLGRKKVDGYVDIDLDVEKIEDKSGKAFQAYR